MTDSNFDNQQTDKDFSESEQSVPAETSSQTGEPKKEPAFAKAMVGRPGLLPGRHHLLVTFFLVFLGRNYSFLSSRNLILP